MFPKRQMESTKNSSKHVQGCCNLTQALVSSKSFQMY